jgi:hypothetical protein
MARTARPRRRDIFPIGWQAGAPSNPPVNSVAPVASGTVTVGDVLTVTTGTWSNSPTSYTYRWRQDGVDIPSAVTSTHTLLLGEVGAMIDCQVTATNADGSGSANSNALGPVVTAAPVLTSASPVDFSDIFVWGQATTSTNSGTLYAVVVASAAATPSAAQIVAGTDAAGAAAPNASLAITSTGAKQVLVRGLTAATSYKVCLAHQAAAGNSNVVTGSFTTDTLIGAYATTGATTGLNVISTSCTLTGTTADPHGGTNAVRWADINDSVTGQITFSVSSATYFSGAVKVHLTVKHGGGSQFIKLIPASMTATAFVNFNTSTGAIGTETFVGTPVAFDPASGWKMLSGVIDMTGADVIGTWNISMCLTDNVTNTNVRNGTNIKDIYNLRFTRV